MLGSFWANLWLFVSLEKLIDETEAQNLHMFVFVLCIRAVPEFGSGIFYWYPAPAKIGPDL